MTSDVKKMEQIFSNIGKYENKRLKGKKKKYKQKRRYK